MPVSSSPLRLAAIELQTPEWCAQQTARHHTVGHNLQTSVAVVIRDSQVHVSHEEVCGHTPPCLSAHSSCCVFQREPLLLSTPDRKQAARWCKGVEQTATPADALGQEQRKGKATFFMGGKAEGKSQCVKSQNHGASAHQTLKPAWRKSFTTTWVMGAAKSDPPPYHNPSKEAANALAAAQHKSPAHLNLQACSALLRKIMGSHLARAFARRVRNCLVSSDQRPPTSPVKTTNRALPRGLATEMLAASFTKTRQF